MTKLRPNRALLVLAAVAALGFVLPLVASADRVCIQVITFAEDPRTGECVAFPTPCDVPKGWKSCGPGPVSLAAPEAEPAPALAVDPLASAEEKGGGACIQVIAFARNPETGVCTMFPTPCDVPDGWEPCQGFPGPTEPI